MARTNINPQRSDPYKNFKFRVEHIVPDAAHDEIRLPVKESVVLDSIIEHARNVREESKVGFGALFHGEKGTGKSKAGEVIANRVGRNVYRIDLSEVVNKYVGETEENLRRVLDDAEESGAILYLDEADALFGKRSEVKDSHDRYANIEINYLLERLESYPGLVILATRNKQDLDEGFLRRLRYVVNFPHE